MSMNLRRINFVLSSGNFAFPKIKSRGEESCAAKGALRRGASVTAAPSPFGPPGAPGGSYWARVLEDRRNRATKPSEESPSMDEEDRHALVPQIKVVMRPKRNNGGDVTRPSGWII